MAITSIIPTANKAPGIYLRVSLGVGPRSSGSAPRFVVLFGNKTAAGTMALETETDCTGEDEARTLAGAGSELYWMAKAALDANPGVRLKLIAVTASGGTAASGTIVVAGTATQAGTIGVSVLGQEVEVPYSAGATAASVATALANAINNRADWPVTGAAATGTVTVTARHAGPRGNFWSVRARLLAGAGLTVTPPAGGTLASGTTSDDPQLALDTVAAVRRHYLVAPYVDATQLAKFRAHLSAEEDPLIGHRRQCVFGATDTLGATTTLATGVNASRMQCAWQKRSDATPGMLAAALAAVRAGKESVNAAYNFDGEVLEGLRPVYSASDRPSSAEIVAALDNGITPLASTDDGDVYVVRSITTRSQDASARPDYRVLDTHKVTVSDEIADRFELAYADRFAHFAASDDPPDDNAPAPGVVTPSMCADLAFELLTTAEEKDGLLAFGSVERRKDELLFELSTVADGRFNGVIPIDVIEHAHQFAVDVRQIG